MADIQRIHISISLHYRRIFALTVGLWFFSA